MKETLASAELPELRTALSGANADQLLNLVPRIRSVLTSEWLAVADGGDSTTGGGGDVQLFTDIEAMLRVGVISLPEETTPRLRQLVEQFASRWMSEKTLEAFETACNELTVDAQQQANEAEQLRAEISRMVKLRDNLEAYLLLLDTLARR
jgi:hypothetical protein